MRVGIIADVHLGNHKRWGGEVVGGLNQRARQCVETLCRARDRALEHECAQLYVLGDLFDSSRPSPPLVSAAMRALAEPDRRGRRLTAHVVLGNHDRQTQHPEDHAASPMAHMAPQIQVYHEPCVAYRDLDVSIVVVPYQPGLASEWLPVALGKVQVDKKTVIMTHVGIWDDTTPGYLKSAHDAVGLGQVRWLCDAHDTKAFFAGNWHQGRAWQDGRSLVMIPGTLCPHSFSDIDRVVQNREGYQTEVGNLIIYDLESGVVRRHSIPGPRFEHITFGDLCNLFGGSSTTGHSLGFCYYRVEVPQDRLQQAINMRDVIESTTSSRVDLVVQEDYKLSVREAAREVVSASRGELTSMWADLVEVREPGTKDGVVRRLEAYRGSSS